MVLKDKLKERIKDTVCKERKKGKQKKKTSGGNDSLKMLDIDV